MFGPHCDRGHATDQAGNLHRVGTICSRAIAQLAECVAPPALDAIRRGYNTGSVTSCRELFDPIPQTGHIDRWFRLVCRRAIAQLALTVFSPALDRAPIGQDTCMRSPFGEGYGRHFGNDCRVLAGVGDPATGSSVCACIDVERSPGCVLARADQTDIQIVFVHLHCPGPCWAKPVAGVARDPRRCGQFHHTPGAQRRRRRHTHLQPVDLAVGEVGKVERAVVAAGGQINAADTALAHQSKGVSVVTDPGRTRDDITGVDPQRREADLTQQRGGAGIPIRIASAVIVYQEDRIAPGIACQRRCVASQHARGKEQIADILVRQPPYRADLVAIDPCSNLIPKIGPACPAIHDRPAVARRDRRCRRAFRCLRPGDARDHVAVEFGLDKAKVHLAVERSSPRQVDNHEAVAHRWLHRDAVVGVGRWLHLR